MEQNTAWNKFFSSGKIADYLAYKNTVGDLSENADKNRWYSDKTTENK